MAAAVSRTQTTLGVVGSGAVADDFERFLLEDQEFLRRLFISLEPLKPLDPPSPPAAPTPPAPAPKALPAATSGDAAGNGSGSASGTQQFFTKVPSELLTDPNVKQDLQDIVMDYYDDSEHLRVTLANHFGNRSGVHSRNTAERRLLYALFDLKEDKDEKITKAILKDILFPPLVSLN